MADVEKDIVLRVKSETEQAQGQFKNLKQELRSIENQLNQMAESGDTGSEAFRKLQQRAGQVKDQIGDTKNAIKALSSDTFKLDAFSQAAQGIAGGFAAAQGAMALFGSENKAVEEAIKKTQGAMALLQGVTAITNILQKDSAFSLLFLGKAQQANTVATEGATVATKGFSKALIATGIGAIVVLIGTLVAYWDDLAEAVSGVSQETEKYLETAKADTESAKKKLEYTKDTENVLKLQGKSQREILNIKIKETDAVIKGIQNQIKGQQLATKQAVEGAQRNKDIVLGILNVLTFPLKILTESVDGIVNGLIETANFFGAGIDFKLNLGGGFDKLKEMGAELLFDPEKIQKEGDKSIEEMNKTLTQMINDQAGFKLEIQKLNEEDAKKEQDRLKKLAEDRKKSADDYNDITIDAIKKTNTLKEQSDEAHQQSLDQLKQYNEANKNLLNAELRVAEARKQIEADLFAKRKATLMEWLQITKEGFDALIQLNEAFSRKDVDGQRKAFERDKKFKIASAITATAMGVAQQLAVPKDQITGLNFAKAAIVLATGIAQIKKISDTQFQGGTSTQINSIGGNIPSPSNQATQTSGLDSTQLQLDAQGNLLQQRSMRTYVLETDISAKQQRSKRLQQTATLGK